MSEGKSYPCSWNRHDECRLPAACSCDCHRPRTEPESLDELRQENLLFRRLLWNAYAMPDGGYGDDGELQWQMRCDFKRDSAAEIEAAIYKRGCERLSEANARKIIDAALEPKP